MNINNLENKHPMNEQEMVNFLLQKGYIEKYEKYFDSKNILKANNENLPEPVLWDLNLLKKLVSLPIMTDSIEELVYNNKRGKIREELNEKDPTLASFYKDNNKLQSSTLGNILASIYRISQHINLSEEIKNELNKLKLELSGSENLREGFFTTDRYKNELSNEKKVDLAKRITILAEDIILESVKK